MAKDPAFLFYPGDWLGGTMTFSRSHKGAYMDLLMAQFNQGKLTDNDIRDVLGSDYDLMWENKLKSKFKVDSDGKFYNEKLLNEQEKRKKFSQSRHKNLSHKANDIKPHITSDMENVNENENENTIEVRKLRFIEKVGMFLNRYDKTLLKEFVNYWTEHNEGGKKMRFEMQKVFDISRRLVTWSNNNKKFNSNGPKKSTGKLSSEQLAELAKEHFARSGK